MLARLRSEWMLWCLGLAGVIALSWYGLADFAFSDYDTEAANAFGALVAGDISGFLSQAPAYGGSLILRAPFAVATDWLGGGELAVFRAVSIPSLVAACVLAIAITRRMDARGASTGAKVFVVALCAANPISLEMLRIGHPEELLCAVFAIGALLAASSRRSIWAVVLLGLAVATKVWAVLAIGPVLLAMPAATRVRALAIAGAVSCIVLAPLVLSGALEVLVHGATATGNIFNPWQIWWAFGEVTNVSVAGNPRPGARIPPEWLAGMTHPLIASLVVPVSLLWWRNHRDEARAGGGEQLLGLLALLLLLRCVLDPWNTVYYQLPFLLALLAWEALCRPQRPPVLTLTATLAVWVTFVVLTPQVGPDVLCAVFLAWSLPLVAWLVRETLWPGRHAGERRAAQPAFA